MFTGMIADAMMTANVQGNIPKHQVTYIHLATKNAIDVSAGQKLTV